MSLHCVNGGGIGKVACGVFLELAGRQVIKEFSTGNKQIFLVRGAKPK